MVEDTLVRSSKEARDTVAKMHGPAAMKIASPDIIHKTEAGGVALHVTEDIAGQTYNQLTNNASHYKPDAHIDGVLVSPMVSGGIELILGAKIDPVFGPVVMAGLGGVFTEVLGDVAFRRAPISEDTAREMVEELHGRAMLNGARGKRPGRHGRARSGDLEALGLRRAACRARSKSVEMNPVRAREHDCIALDALIVRRSLMALPPILQNLRIPAFGAPLFIVQNPDLVIAQCKAGIPGCFPALNAREEPGEPPLLDAWLTRIREELDAWQPGAPGPPGRALWRQPDRPPLERQARARHGDHGAPPGADLRQLARRPDRGLRGGAAAMAASRCTT